MADPQSRTGARYATPELLSWLDALHAPHDAALSRAFATPEREGIPAIHVGPSEGRLLELLLGLVRAARVVEIGTLAGYSAIRLARALAPGGRLWTLELDETHALAAERNLAAAGLASSVTILRGRALELLPTIEPHGPFDAVFVDADKESYAEYGRWAARNVRPGGLLLGDNAFLFGELLADTPRARAMRLFHEEARVAFDTVCIPTPDGLLLGIKR